jgi:diguanylate cyclase (GGDEF)-like protein
MPAIDLTILLWVLIGANVVLIVVAIIWSQLRGRQTRPAPPPNRAQAEPLDRTGVSLAPSVINRGFIGPASAEQEEAAKWTDRLTGLLNLADWNRLVADEDVRHARYKRSATIVMIELDGLERLVTALGQLAADRVLAAVADSIHRHARKADHVARIGPSRFGVLLLETDEVNAINFVERVRQASDLWLESGAIALRLAIGWASPVVDSTLTSAQAIAVERMFAEVHRGALRNRDTDAGPTAPLPGMNGAPSAV